MQMAHGEIRNPAQVLVQNIGQDHATENNRTQVPTKGSHAHAAIQGTHGRHIGGRTCHQKHQGRAQG